MSVTEFKRGVPTYKDKDDNEYGLLCETKEVCVTDNEGVSLEYKIQNLLSEISRLSSELQSCASDADLANYLPKSGGTINGDLSVGTNTTQDGRVSTLINALRKVSMLISGTGLFRLYDYTNSKYIIESKLDGTNTFNGTASGNLPLNGGGTVQANKAQPLIIKRTDTDSNVRIQFDGPNGSMGSLGFLRADTPMFLPSSGSGNKELLHTGNSAKVVVSETAPSDTSALWVW